MASDPPVEGATPFEVPEGATSIEISREFAALKVLPHAGEADDANFPPHLHAAVELFCHVGKPERARACAESVNAYLALLRAGPDGVATNGMGQAVVCWSCGHVGLPRNAADVVGEGVGPRPECAGCGDGEQTNAVRATQPDGTVVPWIERKSAPEADAEARAGAAALRAEALG